MARKRHSRMIEVLDSGYWNPEVGDKIDGVLVKSFEQVSKFSKKPVTRFVILSDGVETVLPSHSGLNRKLGQVAPKATVTVELLDIKKKGRRSFYRYAVHASKLIPF